MRNTRAQNRSCRRQRLGGQGWKGGLADCTGTRAVQAGIREEGREWDREKGKKETKKMSVCHCSFSLLTY